ncbi:hypothetical protein OsI_12164 [Oryza sativa Indica Group]|uniref:Uncharacterized protein n=1 Tax=Oryza sativa subsp. indica TaxID=39946 RepID=B8AKF5_ORYSI|nr:hypothetical protein OsI_12164 [Oryza sativa Indica Group]
MQPSTSAPRSPSLATPAPAVVAAVTVDVFAPWWRRRALTPPATDDATGNTAAVAGNVAAAGTARFLETLIERADCRLVNDIVFVQECPFIEKLCATELVLASKYGAALMNIDKVFHLFMYTMRIFRNTMSCYMVAEYIQGHALSFDEAPNQIHILMQSIIR